MTDELYDYFGGNASKKVEPIEDDEFDNEVEDEVTSQETAEPVAEAVEKSIDEANEPAAADAGGKKAGHWDFLANMLGISSSKKAAPEPDATPVADSVAEKEKEVVAEAEDEGGMFGLEPIPSPEKSSVLSSMFTSGDDSGSSEAESSEAESSDAEDDLIGWNPLPRKSFISEAEEQDSPVGSSQTEDVASEEVEVVYEEGYGDVEVSEGDEVFEFEIEELDPKPRTDEGDATHGRRRRKPARSEDSSDSKSSGARRRGRGEKVSSDSRSDSGTEAKSQRPEARDRDESRSEKPRRGRRSRRGPREGDRQEAAAERRNEPATDAPALTVVVLLPSLLKIPRPAEELTAPEFNVILTVLPAIVWALIP